MKGADCVAFETKVILVSLAKTVRVIAEKHDNPETKKAIQEIYNAIADMANAESVALKPLDQE